MGTGAASSPGGARGTNHSAAIGAAGLRALALCAGLIGALSAQPATEPLTLELIRERQKSLDAEVVLDRPTLEQARRAYETAIEHFTQSETVLAEIGQLEEQRLALPAQIEAARQRLATPLTRVDPKDFEALDDAALLLALERAEARQRATAPTAADTQTDADSRRAERLAEQEALQRRIDTLLLERTQPPQDMPPARLLARMTRLDAALRLERARLSKIEVELASTTLRAELRDLERRQAERERLRAESEISAIEALRDQRRLEIAERREAQAQAALSRRDIEAPPLRRLIEDNARLAAEIARLTGRMNEVQEAARRYAETLRRLDAARVAAERRIEVIGLTEGVGRLLRRDRRGFVRPEEYRARLEQAVMDRSTIAYGRIEREEEARLLATDLETAISARLSDGEVATTEFDAATVRERMRSLLAERLQDLELHRSASAALVETLGERVSTLEHLVRKTEDYFAFIDRRILWIQSAEPVWDSSLGATLTAFRWPIDQLAEPETQTLWRAVFDQVGILAALIAIALLWLVLRLRFVPWTNSQKILSHKGTSVLPTLYGFAAVLVRVFPAPGIALGLFWLLETTAPEPESFGRALADALLTTSGFLAVPLTLRLICAPRGLGEAHFAWAPSQTSRLFRALSWYTVVSVPMVFIEVLLTSSRNEGLIADGARPALLLRSIASTAFFWYILHPKHGVFGTAGASPTPGFVARLRMLWFLLPVLGTVGLSVASAIGYHFSAGQLTERTEQTGGLVVGLVLASAILDRSLVIGRRRLAARRAKERAAVTDLSEEGSAGARSGIRLDTGGVAIEEVDAQTRLLSQLAVATIGIATAWVIWSDMLPAIEMLDSVKLWTSAEERTVERVDAVTNVVSTETQTIQVPITLKSLLIALLIAVATVLGTRNLPGVLEVALLQHLPFGASSRYAITSILRQILVIVGTALVLGQLGLHWAQIQWLVAAMGVGLGFGLQEIFANFISGLIVLFERRVRIGDVVTVGEVTGTVARVQTLATTIIDWDRKEYMLPNKDLVTGRILNWTRTDTVSRMVIPVGVAYGTDTRKVRGMLIELAQAHPLVLKQPPPQAVFESFGDSTLNLSLRCFVGHLSHRLQVQTEILDRIIEIFEREGVEIAFPQRDLHLKGDLAELLVSAAKSGQGTTKEEARAADTGSSERPR